MISGAEKSCQTSLTNERLRNDMHVPTRLTKGSLHYSCVVYIQLVHGRVKSFPMQYKSLATVRKHAMTVTDIIEKNNFNK